MRCRRSCASGLLGTPCACTPRLRARPARLRVARRFLRGVLARLRHLALHVEQAREAEVGREHRERRAPRADEHARAREQERVGDARSAPARSAPSAACPLCGPRRSLAGATGLRAPLRALVRRRRGARARPVRERLQVLGAEGRHEPNRRRALVARPQRARRRRRALRDRLVCAAARWPASFSRRLSPSAGARHAPRRARART